MNMTILELAPGDRFDSYAVLAYNRVVCSNATVCIMSSTAAIGKCHPLLFRMERGQEPSDVAAILRLQHH